MDFLKDLSIDKVRNLAEDAYNQAKPKTDVETRVYEVLSHKNWGASSTIMNEIARDTFDYDRFALISQLMWEAMDGQRPAAWRVVFKGLTLLEHLIKNGSERCVDDARNHGHVLRSLEQFNYYEGTIDRGQGVREKTKQVLDILGDDERIREERQKSRKLREKFGGNLGGVSGGGGGGGGGSRYSGYGNDNWDSRGGGGGSSSGGYGKDSWDSRGSAGGYGDGGIDSKPNGYGGRYDQDDTRGADPTPTFATIPEQAPVKTKKKKKKKQEEPAPPPPEVDLFEFDAPAPAPAAEDEFGDFAGSNGGPTGANDPFASPAPAASDPFAAPAPAAGEFDAFGAAPAPATGQFDAFGAAPAAPSPQFDPFSNAGGAASMPMANGTTMPNNNTVTPVAPAEEEDDFGDFAGAPSSAAVSAPTPASVAAAKSADPLAGLISLDGLTKNKKQVDQLSQPVVANAGAANFLQEKDQITNQFQQGATTMSFQGIDGIQKQQQPNMMMAPTPVGGNAMGAGSSGGASAIDAMDPAVIMNANKKPQATMGGFNMGNGASSGMPGAMNGGGMPGAMNGGGMPGAMGGGGMPGAMGGGGMPGAMGGGGMPGAMGGGGMANGGIMGNSSNGAGMQMTPQQQQQMMMQMMQQGGMQMTPQQQQQMMMQMMKMQQQQSQQGAFNGMGGGMNGFP